MDNESFFTRAMYLALPYTLLVDIGRFLHSIGPCWFSRFGAGLNIFGDEVSQNMYVCMYISSVCKYDLDM